MSIDSTTRPHTARTAVRAGSARPAPRRRLLLGLLGGTSGGRTQWLSDGARRDDVVDIDRYARQAQVAEAAFFDAYFLADGLGFDPTHAQGQPAGGLEPLTTLSALAPRTTHIGLVATASTSFNHPYNLARRIASIDHISRGRAGWNVVTSSGGEANFGWDALPPQEERYRRAAEFVDVVDALWRSWEPDAVVFDRSRQVYADPDKIHRIGFAGDYFRVEGPLNIQRPPQGRPVLFQAGSSASGKEFGARYGEVVYTAQQHLDEALAFRADLLAAAEAHGRGPHALRVLPGLSAVIGDTPEQARELDHAITDGLDWEFGRRSLAAALGGADLSGLELDERIPPERLPDPSALGRRQSRPAIFRRYALQPGTTLRDTIRYAARAAGHGTLRGTPRQVADHVLDWFERGAADGFIVMPPQYPDALTDFTTKVVPLLQEAGVVQDSYGEGTLRHRLDLGLD